jgi:hypothetical protein
MMTDNQNHGNGNDEHQVPGNNEIVGLLAILDFAAHFKSDSSEARQRAEHLLRQAEVITAQCGDRYEVFFGAERAREVLSDTNGSTIRKNVLIVRMEAVASQEDAEQLRKIVQELKGSCCYGNGATAEQVGDHFMFAHEGAQVVHSEGERCGVVVAYDRESAKRYVAWMKAKVDRKISIVESEAVYGRPLEEQLAHSLTAGANCIFLIKAIHEGGDVEYELVVP